MIFFFFHLRFFDGVSFQYFQIFVSFLFSELSDFSSFGSCIRSVICCFPLLPISKAHFTLSNFIPISSLYIVTASIRVSNSYSFLANSFMLSMYIRRLIFFLRFTEFVSAFVCDLVALSLSQMVISAHLPGILAFVFFSQFHSPVFHGILDERYDFVRYLVHFETVYDSALQDYILFLFVINPRHSKIFSTCFVLLVDVLINVEYIFFSCFSKPLAVSILFI